MKLFRLLTQAQQWQRRESFKNFGGKKKRHENQAPSNFGMGFAVRGTKTRPHTKLILVVFNVPQDKNLEGKNNSTDLAANLSVWESPKNKNVFLEEEKKLESLLGG